jgi:hypothetical protein
VVISDQLQVAVAVGWWNGMVPNGITRGENRGFQNN